MEIPFCVSNIIDNYLMKENVKFEGKKNRKPDIQKLIEDTRSHYIRDPKYGFNYLKLSIESKIGGGQVVYDYDGKKSIKFDSKLRRELYNFKLLVRSEKKIHYYSRMKMLDMLTDKCYEEISYLLRKYSINCYFEQETLEKYAQYINYPPVTFVIPPPYTLKRSINCRPIMETTTASGTVDFHLKLIDIFEQYYAELLSKPIKTFEFRCSKIHLNINNVSSHFPLLIKKIKEEFKNFIVHPFIKAEIEFRKDFAVNNMWLYVSNKAFNGIAKVIHVNENLNLQRIERTKLRQLYELQQSEQLIKGAQLFFNLIEVDDRFKAKLCIFYSWIKINSNSFAGRFEGFYRKWHAVFAF